MDISMTKHFYNHIMDVLFKIMALKYRSIMTPKIIFLNYF